MFRPFKQGALSSSYPETQDGHDVYSNVEMTNMDGPL
jgi:hypothetical protein